eukprot:SAG31_NODE_1011_length_10382_cov_8.910240_10_plen_222_part_00
MYLIVLNLVSMAIHPQYCHCIARSYDAGSAARYYAGSSSTRYCYAGMTMHAIRILCWRAVRVRVRRRGVCRQVDEDGSRSRCGHSTALLAPPCPSHAGDRADDTEDRSGLLCIPAHGSSLPPAPVHSHAAAAVRPFFSAAEPSIIHAAGLLPSAMLVFCPRWQLRGADRDQSDRYDAAPCAQHRRIALWDRVQSFAAEAARGAGLVGCAAPDCKFGTPTPL